MNINDIPGRKWRRNYFNNLIEPHLPKDIKIYVEPFAGSFSVANFLKNRPLVLVYNDINKYEDLELVRSTSYNLYKASKLFEENHDRYKKYALPKSLVNEFVKTPINTNQFKVW